MNKKIEKKEIKPLDEAESAAFIRAIQGHRFEEIFMVTLFTGMREGEALGLTWDCIDFDMGTMMIKQALLYTKKRVYMSALPNPDALALSAWPPKPLRF